MTFTNMTGAGLYFACCHREVEPGGSFEVPWSAAKDNRAIRFAMRDGSLGWVSGEGEPDIPGSPRVPTAEELAERAAKAEAEAEERRKAEADRLAKRMAETDEAVKANMARMGHFDMPKRIPRRQPARSKADEKPITRADIITEGAPKSLADAMRHNKAVQAVNAINATKAGKQAKQGKQGKEGRTHA